MSVSAQLNVQAGVWQASQIRRHHSNRAAEERERRYAHARILNRQQLADSLGARREQYRDWIEIPALRVQKRVRLTRYFNPLLLAFLDSLLNGSRCNYIRHGIHRP